MIVNTSRKFDVLYIVLLESGKFMTLPPKELCSLHFSAIKSILDTRYVSSSLKISVFGLTILHLSQ